ncbi:putative diguanylate cyclase YegE [compost metagenome]
MTQRAPDIARKGLSIALPLTTDSLLDASFQDDLLAALDASPLQPEALLLAVDDAVVLQHAGICRPFLQQLQQRGCKLIVNGFGHSLNAFDELHGQKIDYIRVDERFITNVHCNQMDELMVSMLNGATHRVHAQTLAGPAHQQITLNTLQAIGIDLSDGDAIALEQSLTELLSGGYFGIR